MSEIASSSWVPAPLYACLKKADERLGPNRVWRGGTAAQQDFLAPFSATIADISLLGEDEFRAILSDAAEEINAWLRRNGFAIELQPLEPRQFGTAAIVRLGAEWAVQGVADELQMENGDIRPAVRMNSESFTGFRARNHRHPIACIGGKNGSQWFITKATADLEGMALYQHLQSIGDALERAEAGRLVFPKVDFDQKLEPEVMLGLSTEDDNGQAWEVGQCVQQTRIKMNEKGGLAESAAAVAFRCTAVLEPQPPIIIDGPMWLWITKPGMKLPLFSAQFGYDSLKDPGEIEFGKPIVS